MVNPMIVIQGWIQGLTGAFPISSSGHVIVLSALFQLPEIGVKEAVLLHGGSLFAILLFYGRDLFRALTGQWGYRLPAGIGLACLATAGVALPAKFLLFTDKFGSPVSATLLLLLNGLILMVGGQAVGHPAHARHSLRDLRWQEFILLGLLQGLAVLPGISRIGMTLFAGLRMGLNWQDALRLTFIVGIPTILGAGLTEWITAAPDHAVLLSLYLPGIFCAAIGSGAALFLLRLQVVERRFLSYFGFYCISFGLFCLILILLVGQA